MDEKRAGQDWRQSEVEAFRRLLAAHPPLDSKRPPAAAADQVPEKATVLCSDHYVAVRARPARPGIGHRLPQARRDPPAGRRVADAPAAARMAATGPDPHAGDWAGRGRCPGGPVDRSSLPGSTTVPPVTQPAPVPQTWIVIRRAATSACLEAAKRGDELIGLLITTSAVERPSWRFPTTWPGVNAPETPVPDHAR